MVTAANYRMQVNYIFIMRYPMNIKEFDYILCIAKHQNITKAAQELYISQPTLSKYLQKLENN